MVAPIDDPRRKLAAVLAADVVGYSRLIEDDDRETLQALHAARAMFAEEAHRHSGQIVNAPGDSILMQFASATGALECALAVQRAIELCNAEKPEQRRMRFRIGINLGDVLEDASGIYGDGVNVAARLESLAPPGGICVGAPVRDLLVARRDIEFVDLGEHAVKNISRALKVYRVDLFGGGHRPERDRVAGTARPPLSIVVLPFQLLGNDPEQKYLADAITDELTTDLSRIAGSFVIARSTACQFEGRSQDVRAIGKELGVQYALEGSIQKVANRVRVQVQLIETTSASHLWAERFDRVFDDVFGLQDEITGAIAQVLRFEMIQAESLRSQRERPHAPQAIDYVLRAMAANLQVGREGTLAARTFYQKAIRLDPTMIAALTGLAATWTSEVAFEWSEDPAAALAEASRLVEQAAAIAPQNPRVLQVRGLVSLLRRRPEDALPDLEAAFRRDPNAPSLLSNIAWCKLFVGDPEGAVPMIERALNLDPRGIGKSRLLGMLGTALMYLGRYPEAIRYLRAGVDEGLARTPFVYWALAASHALSGALGDARRALDQFRALRPGVTIEGLRKEALSDHPRYRALREKIYEGLRLAGLEG
ncbi:MAG: adenylate/guanylate cyclase domain-containing protein [Gammaproteobacteria bacterium]